ncbi:SDR family NAD(P)-dependent oxidoreductase [Amycolatopsis jejuensis]|uniref:SDR family NAD(P)-dependent oxidoreductase n=1 Tax=Amycolatopsis jejuensis TaxID=330084 RepID=UPI000527A06E|nr:SDR family NAD(P)-dependent oxidoreductase [Amycolatopsis jejuensis]
MGALTGRVVAVTGAGGGLGREHALLMAREGAQVVVNDLRGAQGTVDEIAAAGGQAVAVDGNVADLKVGTEIVAAGVDAFGDLHAVVNNAGFIRDAVIWNMSEEDFDGVLGVHLKGTFSVTKAAVTYWREQAKAGATADRSIVNTSSGSGIHGNAGQFNYSAAKAGSAMMAVSGAKEFKRFGVRSNAIAPVARTAPVMATPGLDELMGQADDPVVFDKFDPAHVSPLVAYLVTADCPFTGQVFSVYGGHVGLFRGWSVEHEINAPRQWPVSELAAELAAFPRHLKVNRQRVSPNEKAPS